MYRAAMYKWNDKPSQSEGKKPLIIQIALQCIWAASANVISLWSDLNVDWNTSLHPPAGLLLECSPASLLP